jgi:cytochrome c5
MYKNLLITTAMFSCFLAASAQAADPGRGKALYEVRCNECHGESVHGRPKRSAKNYDEIRDWVTRWNRELGGFWQKDEIEDVTAYLNERFYSYPCTNVSC